MSNMTARESKDARLANCLPRSKSYSIAHTVAHFESLTHDEACGYQYSDEIVEDEA